MRPVIFLLIFVLSVGRAGSQTEVPNRVRLAEQREALLRRIQEVHNPEAEQMAALRAIFARAPYVGQGNPAVTQHPATREQCLEKLDKMDVAYGNPWLEQLYGEKYMVPLYDPSEKKPEDAEALIDQFEFPNIPCEYPVVWVRAKEAAEICGALGKQLCDAHEWEGACAGRLLPPDYRFDLAEDQPPSVAVKRMREAHNRAYEGQKAWSYGSEYRKGICAASSVKTPGCEGGEWAKCGSNTFPAGFFPDCRSALGVYDLHGNAAEHMNLPLNENQMASRGSRELGHTEMKGSWFIFDTYRAHEDWCRWRAPYWHGSRVMDAESHHNYHLGFRCCKKVERKAGK